jgi:shikimate kinase
MILSQPIVFVGMMGCGKTSIGRVIAEKLNLEFFDTDKEIENNLDLSIKEIFENYGEKFFRRKEYSLFEVLNTKSKILISAGGGSFCEQKIHTLIKKNFISVWLDVNEKTIFYRLRRNQAKRPLLKGMNERELRIKINNLMIERNSCYSKADIKVKLSDQTISESINKTYSKIINYLSENR